MTKLISDFFVSGRNLEKVKFLILPLLILFTGSTAFSQTSLKWCYNQAKNRIYFFKTQPPINSICESDTYFDPKDFKIPSYHLYDSTLNESGFPSGSAKSSKTINISGDRKVLATHWNNMGQHNLVVVIEPDFKKKTVQRHCKMFNHADTYDVQFRKKGKKLYIKVRRPQDKAHETFKKVWMPCKV